MDEEETKSCPNCKREIPAVNFTIHSVHCARNIKICPVCKEPVPGAELDVHHQKMHKLLPCRQCGESVCGTDLEDHIRDSCGNTVKTCRFCELELPRRELPTHEGYCGVRTEQCPDCKEYIMIKYHQLHLDTNHGFIRLDDDPAPPKKEPPKLNLYKPVANANFNKPNNAKLKNIAQRPTSIFNEFPRLPDHKPSSSNPVITSPNYIHNVKNKPSPSSKLTPSTFGNPRCNPRSSTSNLGQSPINSGSGSSDPRQSLSNPRQELSDPRQSLSNPRQNFSNPRPGSSNPRQTLSNTRQELSDNGQSMSNPRQSISNPRPDSSNPRQSLSNPRQELSDNGQSISNPRQSISNSRPDSSNPRQSLSNPRQELSDPGQNVSNPRQSLSNPRPDSSNPRQSLSNPIPDSSNPRQSLSNTRQELSEPGQSLSNPRQSFSNPRPDSSNDGLISNSGSAPRNSGSVNPRPNSFNDRLGLIFAYPLPMPSNSESSSPNSRAGSSNIRPDSSNTGATSPRSDSSDSGASLSNAIPGSSNARPGLSNTRPSNFDIAGHCKIANSNNIRNIKKPDVKNQGCFNKSGGAFNISPQEAPIAVRACGVKKRTNDQPQINMDTSAIKTVDKDLGVSRGAVKKRPAPAPPAPRARRDLPYYSALQRQQLEERDRTQLNDYNLAHGLPPVLNAAQKLEKLRKLDALQNRDYEEDYRSRQRRPSPEQQNEEFDSGHRLGAYQDMDEATRQEFKNLKPMSPSQFMRRFSSLQVSPPSGRCDRFPEIKSSLQELRRGLNEVTAPYNANNNSAVSNNNDRARTPSPSLPMQNEEVQLPCEFCNMLVPADDLVQHQTGCRPDLAQLVHGAPSPGASPPSPRAAPPSPRSPADPVIPCEFCMQSLPVYLITEHQEQCIQDNLPV